MFLSFRVVFPEMKLKKYSSSHHYYVQSSIYMKRIAMLATSGNLQVALKNTLILWWTFSSQIVLFISNFFWNKAKAYGIPLLLCVVENGSESRITLPRDTWIRIKDGSLVYSGQGLAQIIHIPILCFMLDYTFWTKCLLPDWNKLQISFSSLLGTLSFHPPST
jgi:hypothetical protein